VFGSAASAAERDHELVFAREPEKHRGLLGHGFLK
jgi:hypothetical protein